MTIPIRHRVPRRGAASTPFRLLAATDASLAGFTGS